MSTLLWPACASRLRLVRGSPLEVSLTDTSTIETNCALLVKRQVLLQSNATKPKSNYELLEAHHDVVAGTRSSIAGNKTLSANALQLTSNYGLLGGNKDLLDANAEMMRSNHELLPAIAAKLGVAA